MSIDVLAAGSPAEAAGRLTVTIGIPLLGLILLIVRLRQRSKSRSTPPFEGSPNPYPSAPPQQPDYQQGYPPPYQGGYPPGYVPVPPQTAEQPRNRVPVARRLYCLVAP